MFERILTVLYITLPVFAMIGLGNVLSQKKIMTAEHRAFINKLIFNFSLPALIFMGVAGRNFSELIKPSIIVGGIVPVFLIVIVAAICAKLFNTDKEQLRPLLYSGFWANVSYLGFPLAERAFGEDGVGYTAILNAFAAPTFVVVGTLILGIGQKQSGSKGILSALKATLTNPVTIAALLGLGISFIGSYVNEYPAITIPAELVGEFLKLGGKMGLPLALIAIGGALTIKSGTSQKRVIVLGCIFKSIVTPLITWGLLLLLFPNENEAVIGCCVMLMGTPSAVASYVVATGSGVPEDTASSLVVWTTLTSIITIPTWLYFLL